jgi:hypothetical protein
VIPLILWQLRWRLLVVCLIAGVFYLIEPNFHLHADAAAAAEAGFDPGEIAFTLANLAGASMLVLLSGFIAGDRRRGYYRMYFSHPTRPLAYYGLRWGIAYVLTLLIAGVFLVVSQLAAWGELRAGASSMLQPALFALIYGALVAFCSIAFTRGDSLIAFGIYLATDLWQGFISFFFSAGLEAPLSPTLRQLVAFVLPPHLALREAYTTVQAGSIPWVSIAVAGGYGLFWLVAAGLLIWSREWP